MNKIVIAQLSRADRNKWNKFLDNVMLGYEAYVTHEHTIFRTSETDMYMSITSIEKGIAINLSRDNELSTVTYTMTGSAFDFSVVYLAVNLLAFMPNTFTVRFEGETSLWDQHAFEIHDACINDPSEIIRLNSYSKASNLKGPELVKLLKNTNQSAWF